VLGLDAEIRIEPADTMNPGDSVRQQNPLGKIPALVSKTARCLFDSPRASWNISIIAPAAAASFRPEASARFSACACRRSPTASWMRRSLLVY
jgi:hypothetical protein